MTELEFLERQETLATRRLQRALLGGDGMDAPLDVIERATIRRPLLAVGAATALGSVLGVLIGRTSGRTLITLMRVAGKPLKTILRAVAH